MVVRCVFYEFLHFLLIQSSKSKGIHYYGNRRLRSGMFYTLLADHVTAISNRKCHNKQISIPCVYNNGLLCIETKNRGQRIHINSHLLCLLFQGQEKQMQTIYANGGFVTGEELEMPKDENDIVHYGEIDFSTPQTKIPTVQGSGQETVYAEVRGPGREMNQD